MQTLINEEELNKEFLQLKLNVARLRSTESGCPWFRQQTFSTLRKYLLEEVYEVQDALNGEAPGQLQEELGDLLFQVVVLSHMASEQGWFSLAEVLRQLNAKIIHRNPHIFGELEVDTVEEAQRIWSERKLLEKEAFPSSVNGLSTTMPALALAQAYIGRCGLLETGWSFPYPSLIHDFEARLVLHPDGMEAGLGRMFFMLVDLAQRHHLDAEAALRKINAEFRQKVDGQMQEAQA